MKYPVGPRQRRRRKRRAGKLLVLIAVVLMLLLASTWTVWQPPEPVSKPTEQDLAMARNLYALSGDRGYAHEYLVQWPDWADEIRGEK